MRDITFYPNYLYYDSDTPENGINFNPSLEPSITGDTYTSSGGETSGALYDLVDNRQDSLLTINSNAGTGSETINYDLTTQITDIDTCIVGNNNFGTADAKVKIEHTGGSVTLSLGSVLSSTSYLLDETYHGYNLSSSVTVTSNEAIPLPGQNGIMLLPFITMVSAINFDIQLNDDSTYSDDITIGEIILSRSHTPTLRPNLINRETATYGTELMTTKGGQNYGHGTHGERKGWTLTYEYMTLSQKQLIEQVYRVTKGGRYPMYVDLGESSNPILYYCRFVPGSWNVSELTTDAYQVTFDLITEV